MTYFPREVIEHIFSYLIAPQDRNSLSLVCKSWFVIERKTRRHVFVANCYAVEPARVAARFPGLRSLTVKGKPQFVDFYEADALDPWGGSAGPWVEAMAQGCPGLEQIRLQGMIVSDLHLLFLAKLFPNLKSLVLVRCEQFSTFGLAAIASDCSQLRELVLRECSIDDSWPDWMERFPDSFTSLETLNFTCLEHAIDTSTLEKLVARCPNFRVLHVNRDVLLDCLSRILMRAPQLFDLGTGPFAGSSEQSRDMLCQSFRACKRLKALSGFWFASNTIYLTAVHPVCANLLSLNLSCAYIEDSDLTDLILHCPRLQKLWVLHQIGDNALIAVGSTCKDLRELKVLPSDDLVTPCQVTEKGLLAVSAGCPKLNSLSYFCVEVTNSSLVTIAKNCADLIQFKLHLKYEIKPDPITGHPLDEGFGAIVQHCKGLKRLSLSGLLTDQVFLYIGMYAEQLEMLSVAYAGGTDNGMKYVFNGCKSLRKVKIENCRFGDEALLDNVTKCETLRSLWVSSCDITIGGCKAFAARCPTFNVEVIEPRGSSNDKKAEMVYIYRTVAGRRNDAPGFVLTI